MWYRRANSWKLSRLHNDRAVILQRRIEWIEHYYDRVNINDLKALRQELADLLEDAKADKLRFAFICIAAEFLAGN